VGLCLQGEPRLIGAEFFKWSEVALSQKRMSGYALDNADIVREALFQQLT